MEAAVEGAATPLQVRKNHELQHADHFADVSRRLCWVQ